MAWVKERDRRNGAVYYSVFFRELNHETGKMQQTSISWNDRADADRCCELIEQLGPDRARDVMKIVQSPRTAQTVAQFLTKHIDHLTGVEPGTVARYHAYVRNDLGSLGAIPISALTREDIARWVNGLPGSAKTVKNKRDFLSGALKGAVKAGLLPSNPAEGVRNPRWDRREMVFLEKAEFAILIDAVPEYWQPLVQFLVSSGCRWSEATALKPSDIDPRAGTVRVTKAWKTGAGGYTLGVPKTRKSVRTINVPSVVLDRLDLTGEWVFTNSGAGKGRFSDGAIRDDDSPVRTHSFNPNVWVPAVKRAKSNGLAKTPRIHDLRHTCASWLIQAGRPLPAVQAQLGHESIQTTSDVYGHLDRSSGRDNADVIAGMLA